MNEKIIEIVDLKKSFGKQEVLKGLNLYVEKGEIYSLLGMNGAGKTTVIKILSTLLKKDSGQVIVKGYDVTNEPRKVQELISLTGQFAAVDDMFTGKENLELIGKLRHIPDYKKVADDLLKQFDLQDSKDKLVYNYSGGMKRRLDIAMSLIGNPQIIFLDEPTTGLDPKSRREVWNLIISLKEKGVTVFLTTQYIEEAEKLADRVGILKDGVLIAEGSPAKLKTNGESNLEEVFLKLVEEELR